METTKAIELMETYAATPDDRPPGYWETLEADVAAHRFSLTREEAAPIPPVILARVALHVAALHRWNTAILQARAMEAVTGQPGRYEYDIRYGTGTASDRLNAYVGAALLTLEQVEGQALAHGVTLDALYAGCGGKPVLLVEGAAVRAWGHAAG